MPAWSAWRPGPDLPPTKQRTPALHRRIVEAAIDLLGEDGVGAVTARAVAAAADTSVAAVYELCGDKGGVVREVFFEGFRRLGERLGGLERSDDQEADMRRVMYTLRRFSADHPRLAEVMFARPFEAFEPGPGERAAGEQVRTSVVEAARRAVDAGVVDGDPTDIAHVVLAVTQGLAAQEAAGWLGTSRASVDRRWSIAHDAVIDGLRPA